MPDWSAFRNSDYGYSRMFIHNKTHLEIEQVSDDKKGQIVDHFYIVKDNQIPFWLINSNLNKATDLSNVTILDEMSNEINVMN